MVYEGRQFTEFSQPLQRDRELEDWLAYGGVQYEPLSNLAAKSVEIR